LRIQRHTADTGAVVVWTRQNRHPAADVEVGRPRHQHRAFGAPDAWEEARQLLVGLGLVVNGAAALEATVIGGNQQEVSSSQQTQTVATFFAYKHKTTTQYHKINDSRPL
jgi:hypothetical protein